MTSPIPPTLAEMRRRHRRKTTREERLRLAMRGGAIIRATTSWRDQIDLPQRAA